MMNKNNIIYNPDYYTVNITIDNLNKVYENKYIFKNQRITKLSMQYLENEFGGIPFSSMNKSGDELFHSEFIKIMHLMDGLKNQQPKI